MIIYPFKVPALRVEQPLGVFYVAVLPADLLLEVAFSDALSATFVEGTQSYELHGTQRLPQPKRLEPIAEFINRNDAAFPNAIILAANYRIEDGLDEEDPALDDEDGAQTGTSKNRRWQVESVAGGGYELTIPTPAKLAAIIDGQHRLFAFARAIASRRDMHLICSIFLDLPKPYQAQLFATINSTQKPVDKSLTFELFGYNIAEEKPEFWSPDKLAVFLTRRLATDPESALAGRITIAPKRDSALELINASDNWKVSTAVVVEGIMRLITTNPKKDGNSLLKDGSYPRDVLVGQRNDRSPLRGYYIQKNDALIYQIALNFVRACQNVFWEGAAPGSFIVKTVGVQALFDVLRSNVDKVLGDKDISVTRFESLLEPAGHVDFSSVDFRNASGSGRSKIRKEIQGFIDAEA